MLAGGISTEAHFYDIPEGQSVTVSEPLTDVGGPDLVKDGGGTLILTGSNSYSGSTYLRAGTLSLTGSGAVISHITSPIHLADGIFNLLNGATLVTGDGMLASSPDNQVSVLVDGPNTSWSVYGNMRVGDAGSAVLEISGGALLTTNGVVELGYQEGGTDENQVRVTIDKGVWENTGDLIFGNVELEILNGGRLTTNADVIFLTDAPSEITISGSGSVWHHTSTEMVLDFETTIVLRDGGRLQIADGSGTLVFNDVTQFLLIGDCGCSDVSAGAGYFDGNRLTVSGSGNGGSVLFNHNETDYTFAADIEGSIYLAHYAGVTNFSGTLNLEGIGGIYLSGGTARLLAQTAHQLNRVLVTSGAFEVGPNVQASMDVLALADNGRMTVSGNNASVTVDQVALVGVPDGVGVIPGELHISDGARVDASELYIGLGETQGKVRVSGEGTLLVAENVLSLGEYDDSVRQYFSGDVMYGYGWLGIDSGATVRVGLDGSGTLVLGGEGEYSSFLVIGSSEVLAAAGTLEAARVTGGSIGGGAIYFNHTGSHTEPYQFAPEISGLVFVVQISGVTDLMGQNTHTGYTSVIGGTLRSGVAGALSPDSHLYVFNEGSVYDLNGFSETVAGLTVDEGGQVINGTLTVDGEVELYSGRVSAVLAGTSGVSKTGDGLMILEGDQLYTGSTQVYAGTLNLVGSTQSASEVYGGRFVVTGTAGGDVLVEGGSLIVNGVVNGGLTVENGGLVGGDGWIAGNLTSRGVVSPGNSPGILTVAGDYVQAPEGTLLLEFASPSKYDRLAVLGSAQLDGVLALRWKHRPKQGEIYTILTAADGVAGEFGAIESSIGANSLLQLQIDYRNDSVVLSFTEESFLDFAKEKKLSANARAVARALDAANAKGRLGELMDVLYLTDLSQLPNTLAVLSPEALTQIFQIGFSNAQVQYGNLERRMSDLREGAAGFSTNGLALANARGSLNYDGLPVVSTRDGLSLAGWDGKSMVGKQAVAPVVEQSRWGFFATGSGEWADVETTAQARGSEFSTGGITVGADYRVNRNLVVGLAAGYANTGSDLFNGGKVEVNSGRGSAYATLYGDGYYLNAAVGGAYNSYRTKRATLGGHAHGKTNGGEFNALLGGGYDYRAGGFTVGPVASLQYTYLGLDGFTERGSLVPMSFPSQNQNSLKGALGARVVYTWRTSGVSIRPELRLQWQHEFLDSTAALESGFAGGGTVFTVRGPELGRDALLLDAGVTVQFDAPYSIYAAYTAELGRKNYSTNVVSGGVRIQF